VRQPNPLEPPSDTFEKIINAMTRHGGAWLHVLIRNQAGLPQALEVVDESRVTYQINAANTLFTQVAIDGKTVPLPDMVYVPLILETNSPIGKSPLKEINDALLQLNAAMVFSAGYYTDAATPPYALISPTRLQADKAAELLTAWQEARDLNRPAVISGNLELKTFTPVSAADALVLEAINYLDAVITRVMQIPPTVLNTLAQSSLTYSTQVEANRQFLMMLRATYLVRLEAAFTTLLPRGLTAAFDTSSLTRMNEREQLDYDIAAVEAGIMTVDEIRDRRGLSRIERTTVNVDTTGR
jgi:HK97 family phage portal protein